MLMRRETVFQTLLFHCETHADFSIHLFAGTVNISSFFVNQQDMFQSVLRVTGDKESDWKIHHEDVKERYEAGKAEMQKGSMKGFGKMLYARLFYPDGAADFNDRLDNDRLGLPKENLDDMTKVAVEMAARGETNMIPG